MKLTPQLTREIYHEDHEDWETVEEGDFTQDGKYQYCDSIVKHVPTGKFYQLSVSRSGSPFTDWYWSYEDEGAELVEVHKVTRTVTTEVWEPIGSGAKP